MPNHPDPRPHLLPKPHPLPGLRPESRSKKWAGPVAVTLLSLTFLGWDLPSELHFVDESAYLSQSFYADLWLTGKWDDPAWLSYAGYDLPPLPKYVIGIALRLSGHRRPGHSTMVAWYRDTSSRFVSDRALVAARIPSVGFGTLGCLAIYAIGTLALDRRLGLLAAFLLMLNPLYCMHARRAMSDVPAESLILASLAVGLWAWKQLLLGNRLLRPSLALVLGAGVLGGLATLSKLNGALGGMVLAAWALLAIPLPGFRSRSKAAYPLATLLSGCVSVATFAALNPFLFAHPKGTLDPRLESIARLGFLDRLKAIPYHRTSVSDGQRKMFPNDALSTPLEKIEVVVVQGFGRFGHFGTRGWTDSTIRFDWDQDRGALAWLPWVLVGLTVALARGRTQLQAGQPPTAWAVVVQAGVGLLVVTAFIPLAWDRYFLSIQPGFALLGAFAVVEGFDLVRRLLGRRTGTEIST
jgi:4-amino-4-deoxy-L-arabinose transferase-like glycosyltransferase